MEQLLEGAYLSSEDHVAALLLVHPERHGHIFVAQCTEAAASYTLTLTLTLTLTKAIMKPLLEANPNPHPNPNTNQGDHGAASRR